MNRYLVPALCGVLFVTAAAMADDASKKEPGKNPLIGTYKIVSGETDGTPAGADKIEQNVVRITQDQMIGVDKEANQVFVAKYEIVNDQEPFKLTMKSKAPDGKVMQTAGMAKVEGDKLQIIYSLPGGPEPSEFKTQKGQHMFVMQKIEVSKDDDNKRNK